MVNAWSLAWEEMNGTMDETYPVREDVPPELWNKPIQRDFKVTNEYGQEHSPYYYDYKRNDPNAKNPFTDAFDYMMAEAVVNGDDGYPSKFTTLSDNDDQIAHHVSPDPDGGINVGGSYEELNLNIQANSPYNDGWTQDFYKEELENMTDSRNKYHEKEILKDIEDYVSGTYNGHYTGTKHEYRNVQTLDLMASRDLASDFCQANILKYGSRYGSKDGRNKKDLLKVIHYAMLLLHFDEHYGKPKMTSGNIDHNMP